MSVQFNLENQKNVPFEVKGWNWGAFFLTWIWGICNGTLISLLCLIPGLHFIMMFVLGAKGNEWAWRNKNWDSVESFHAAQRKWAAWGLGLWIVGAVLLVVVPFGILGVGLSLEWPNMQRVIGEFEEHRRFANYAVAEAERDGRASGRLGLPLALNGPVEAVRGKDGYTEISIPVRGPKGSGTLYLRSRKAENDEAKLEQAELELEGLERLKLRTPKEQRELIADEKRIALLSKALSKETSWTKREPKGEEEAESFYMAAVQRVENDANVKKVFGDVITAQLEDARVKFEGPTGQASFKVAVSGNGKTGVLQMDGKRSMGRWTSDGGRLSFSGGEISFPPGEIAPQN